MTIAATPRVTRRKSERKAEPMVLEGVSWETYERLLRDFDRSGQHMRVTYDDGRMSIVSPLPKHEKWKSLLGNIVEAIAYELKISISTFGSTTWKRRDRRKGLEPDECFYVQKEAKVRAKLSFNLKRDPPPDLAIEVDIRRHSVDRLAVYASLGIKEVWEYDGKRFRTLLLGKGGSYRNAEYSAAFPFLRPADLKKFLDMYGKVDQNSIVEAVRAWVRELPR